MSLLGDSETHKDALIRENQKIMCCFAISFCSASVFMLLSSGRRRKSKTAALKKEEKLLRQLRQITQLMQEGRLEGASPEMEAEEVPYGADWEGAC